MNIQWIKSRKDIRINLINVAISHLLIVQLLAFFNTWLIVGLRLIGADLTGIPEVVSWIIRIISPLTILQSYLPTTSIDQYFLGYLILQILNSLFVAFIAVTLLPKLFSFQRNRRAFILHGLALFAGLLVSLQNFGAMLKFREVSAMLEFSELSGHVQPVTSTQRQRLPLAEFAELRRVKTSPEFFSFKSERGMEYLVVRRDRNEPTESIMGTIRGTGEILGFKIDPMHSDNDYRVTPMLAKPHVDSDGDGMSDIYEQQYRSVLNPNDSSDASRDSDGDELTNYEESEYDWDPTSKESPTPVQLSGVPGGKRLKVIRFDTGISENKETVPQHTVP